MNLYLPAEGQTSKKEEVFIFSSYEGTVINKEGKKCNPVACHRFLKAASTGEAL